MTPRQVYDEYAKLLERKLKAQLRIDRSVATQDTLDSVDGMGREDGIDVFANESLFYVDEGRKPGSKPSAQAIYRWFKAKGIQPRDSGRFASRGNASQAKGFEGAKVGDVRAAYSIAKAIGRLGTIKRYGYGGSGIIDFVFDSIEPEMREAISVAYLEAITKSIDEAIDDGNTN